MFCRAVVTLVLVSVAAVLIFAAPPISATLAPRKLSQITHTFHANVPPHPPSPPSDPHPPAIPHASTCRLVYGLGDCSEFNFCSGNGNCTDGRCTCPLGYIDSNCSTKISCRYWDDKTSEWSAKGVVTHASSDGLQVRCETTHRA